MKLQTLTGYSAVKTPGGGGIKYEQASSLFLTPAAANVIQRALKLAKDEPLKVEHLVISLYSFPPQHSVFLSVPLPEIQKIALKIGISDLYLPEIYEILLEESFTSPMFIDQLKGNNEVSEEVAELFKCAKKISCEDDRVLYQPPKNSSREVVLTMISLERALAMLADTDQINQDIKDAFKDRGDLSVRQLDIRTRRKSPL